MTSPSPLARTRAAAAAVPVAARSLRVMTRAGLFHPHRLDWAARSSSEMRRWGAVVAGMRLGARQYADRPALVDERGTLTFREVEQHATALARAWRAEGLTADDTVGALCRDHRGLVLTMAAAGLVGARCVLLNTGFAAPQLRDVLAREQVGVLVLDAEFAALADGVPDTVRRVLAWSQPDPGQPEPPAWTTLDDLVTRGLDAAAAGGPGAAPLPRPPHPGPLVLLTSGTTGTPKGAPRRVSSPFAPAQFLDRIPLKGGEATVLAAPLFHGTGLSQYLLSVGLGSATVLRRRFDPEATLAAIQDNRAGALVVVPTMLQRILDLPAEVRERYDTSSLRILFCAGSSLPVDLGNRATAAFGDVVHNLYGSTECAVATVATPEDWRTAPGTVGKPPVGCRVALYGKDGSLVTEPGVVGEIYCASGLTFAGYTDGSTKPVRDGLMASGDVGHWDANGLLFVDGRADDMVVSGGENVYPVEVEDLLTAHPGVTEACVVGVPDEEFGARLAAYVVRQPTEAGAALDEATVKDLVKQQLARHKVPRDVVFLRELPRNATGKVLKPRLAEAEREVGRA